MPILQWDLDQKEILSRLRNPSRLMLCCKTLSEPEMVKEWIEHHRKIVGSENLIIADNGSSDAASHAVYESYREAVTIFQFSGPHNDIHWHPRFKPFYDRIRELSELFSFIDVDERLIWIDQGKWSADQQILSRLKEDGVIYPATWLINAIGSLTRFTLLDTERRPILSNNLRWGKPILPVSMVGAQPGIHNVQYVGNRFSSECAGRLFLLHLTQFPEQRITANIKKLANRGVVDSTVDQEAIPTMDFKSFPDKTVLRFQNEIAEMVAYLKGDDSIKVKEKNTLELLNDGSIVYSNEEAQNLFSQFGRSAATVIAETFK